MMKYSTILTAVVFNAICLVTAQAATAETSTAFSDADYAAHIKELRKKAPGDQFTIIITPPFVVIGDESPSEVKRRAEGTVAWAVKKLKQAYFSKDPDEILDIWLFKDKTSYEQNAQRAFRQKARHALRLLLGPGSRLSDEHCHGRRHAGSRDSASLYGGQFSRLPFLA